VVEERIDQASEFPSPEPKMGQSAALLPFS
jgi:hypothetical protein